MKTPVSITFVMFFLRLRVDGRLSAHGYRIGAKLRLGARYQRARIDHRMGRIGNSVDLDQKLRIDQSGDFYAGARRAVGSEELSSYLPISVCLFHIVK